jgi:tryptophan synthase beta chain
MKAARPITELRAASIELPDHWRNLLADYPQFNHNKLPEAVAGQVSNQFTHLPKMPLAIGRQSYDTTNRYIRIPNEVLELYRLYRPTPLRRARIFEQALGTSAQIYYKYEGANISGSHKLNSAIAQAYYYQKAGVRHVVTGTGAGQWGSAIAFACARFGLECTIFMPRVSLQQKPMRRTMMELFGAKLHESPSELTGLGRRTRAENPEKLGTLAIATGEALELAATREKTLFAVGSGENHVLLHQTIIGEEALRQMWQLGVYPDVIFACMGAGSNFAGIAFPFLGADDNELHRPRLVAVEPEACPKLTRGRLAYTETDFSGTTPIARMITLGSGFEAPGIHAGGLRYHGTSPFLSEMFAHGLFEAAACAQREVFHFASLFARSEGVLAAPESAHAICAAAEEAVRDPARRQLLLVNISGMGYHDLSGYYEFLTGTLDDGKPSEEMIQRSLATLAEEQEKYAAVPSGPAARAC